MDIVGTMRWLRRVRFDGRFLRAGMEDDGVGSTTLQERFPQETTSRIVLANALFHTCCTTSQRRLINKVLATKGVLVVSQPHSYGEISLQLA